MLPLKRVITHPIHLLVKDHLVLGMDHLLRTTTHPLLPLLLLLHTQIQARDMGIYQLDPLLQATAMAHLLLLRHRMHLRQVHMPLLLLTHRQVEVGIIPIQVLHRVTEALRLRIPLLAMEHHPLIPLIAIINPHLLHIILILNTTPLLPLQEDTPNPHLQDTHNLLLHLMIQLLRGIDQMYLLLLIHDDHLLLRDKASIGHLKGRVVKLGICWLDLIRTDKDRTRRRRN